MSGWSVAESRVPPFTNALAEHLISHSRGGGARHALLPPEEPPPKQRRGPKVKATPADSPLVERNRQAQRAHRSRKETYVRGLEVEVARLRELCANLTKERDALAEQNAKLSKCLDANRARRYPGESMFNVGPSSGRRRAYTGATSSRDRSTGSQSQSASSSFSFESTSTMYSRDGEAHLQQAPLDYDAIGIDFVTTLESPCKQHMPYLEARAQTPNPAQIPLQRPEEVPNDDINLEISGHALMASCPSATQVQTQVSTEEPSLPSVPTPSLVSIYGLSDQIFDLATGELPPIKAWVAIKQDPRFPHFQLHHFQQLKEQLYRHVICLRFGAVIPVEVLDNTLRDLDLT